MNEEFIKEFISQAIHRIDENTRKTGNLHAGTRRG